MIVSSRTAVLIGTSVELYDYSLYSYFANEIGKSFFPNSELTHSIIYTFLIFSVAYLVRPIGGILLSHYSDRYGRKLILYMSLLMMICNTFIIGITPSAAVIGIAAPMLLFIARIMQGLAISGEFVSGLVYVIEGTERKSQGLSGSLVFASGILGMLIGILVHSLLSNMLTTESLLSWGWRIPFMMSLPVYFLAYYIRFRLYETCDYLETIKLKGASLFPLKDAFIKSPFKILAGFIVTLFSSTVFYTCFMFMPTYLSQIILLDRDNINFITAINTFIYMLALPVFGYLADRYGKLNVLSCGFLMILLLIFPFYYSLLSRFSVLSYAVIFLFPLVCAAYIAPIPSILCDLYDVQFRSSGISLVYNTAVALSGGFASLTIFWLIDITHFKIAPAIYVISFIPIVFFTLLALYNSSLRIKGLEYGYLRS